MTYPLFIDVSGVGNTGKSAVVDLLREFDGVFAPHYSFEFDLIRVLNGLLDLRYHLTSDWSPVRSHAAIRAFLQNVNRMGKNPEWWNLLGLMTSTSQRYDQRFSGKFIEYSNQFAESLIEGKYEAEWPYDNLLDSPFILFLRKILRRLGFRRYVTRSVFLVNGINFDEKATQYISKLYELIIPNDISYIVLNNGFEPFNPIPSLNMLKGSKQIFVTRDPRDVYVSGLNYHKVSNKDKKLLAFDNDGMNKSFLATDDLNLFIKRYRLYNENLYKGKDSRVLAVRFEDICFKYPQILKKIQKFLNISPQKHSSPQKFFNPKISQPNVGIWKNYSNQDEIRIIEQNLKDYLVS